jgi:hypothetical protein
VISVLHLLLSRVLAKEEVLTADYLCQLCLGLLQKCCEAARAAGDATGQCPLTDRDFRVQTVLACVKDNSRSTAVKCHAFLLLGLAGSMFPVSLFKGLLIMSSNLE